MHKLLKSIPTTGDMVSLWLPSGQNRAMDIIRGNHGQCYGTHPNVLVQPNLINPSLGWHFDGTDDFMDFGNPSNKSLDLGTNDFTLGAWVYSVDFANEGYIISKFQDWDHRWYIRITNSIVKFYSIPDAVEFANATNIGDSEWHLVIVVGVRGIRGYVYIDGNDDTTGTPVAGNNNLDNTGNLQIGVNRTTLYPFNGHVVLPFIANQAWSSQQVSNFYLATRDFFWPRG